MYKFSTADMKFDKTFCRNGEVLSYKIPVNDEFFLGCLSHLNFQLFFFEDLKLKKNLRENLY